MKRLNQVDPRFFALGLALLVVVWLLSGLGAEAEDDTTLATEESEAGVLRVLVKDSSAQDMVREAVVAGFSEPLQMTKIRAEVGGRVIETPVERGASVKAGQIILRLDQRDRPGQLQKAKDLYQQRQLQYKAAQRLKAQGHISDVELASAKANLSAAQADVQRLESELERTTVRAPFDGVLDQRPPQLGDFANVGDLLASVLNPEHLLIVGYVSEDEVGYLRAGQSGRAIMANGDEVTGSLHYVAAQSEPDSRTFRVELLVANEQEHLVVGTSGMLMLPLEHMNAHIVDAASLALSKAGEFGIKAVDENNRVVFHAAEIAQNREEGVWLTGLPDQLRVITVGQGFVSAGDEVKPVPEKP